MAQREMLDRKPLDSLSLKLKKVRDQVIVITGATSGIGLVTARQAAERGAKLVLAGREEESLHKLAEELGTSEKMSCTLKWMFQKRKRSMNWLKRRSKRSAALTPG